MKWLSSISSRLLRRKIFDPVEEGSTKLGKYYYMSITFKSQKNEFYFIIYRKVANNSLSRLVAHFQIFRRLMKGKFDA